MVHKPFKVSAPGSLMLFGEHAVLHDKGAIACAVDQRITITVTPKTDRKVRIRSSLGQYDEHIDDLLVAPPFTFMLTAIQNDPVFTGAIFDVDSGFDSHVGLGSSAAVTVATVAALRHMRDLPLDPKEIFSDALLEVRQAQGGRGSGTDVAASIYGGIIHYRATPEPKTTPLQTPELPPISLIYCGYKVPTPEVIATVEEALKKTPDKGASIYTEMGKITEAARSAMEAGDWPKVGQHMNAFHTCQQALGTSNEDLEDLVGGLREQPGILGAKISGSGLGDCVVGLGQADAEVETFEKVPVAIGQEGVRFEQV